MVSPPYKSDIAAFLYDELQCEVSAQTLAFVCSSVDSASLDIRLNDPYDFPRSIATVSLAEVLRTDYNDHRPHYTVDLFDRHFIPIGSIRIYLNGECRLLRDSSDEAKLAYKARIGLFSAPVRIIADRPPVPLILSLPLIVFEPLSTMAESVKITHFETNDVRFPTSLTGDGTDAMNTECDYSSAYVSLFTNSDLVGYGMTFTIGRGNDIVCKAIAEVAKKLIGREIESLFVNMGQTFAFLLSDPQLRWLGPEKGIIHIATGAVSNALWDIFARSRKKPLWKLIVDFTPEEFVRATTFRYITDAITPEEALQLLKTRENGKREREERARKEGYPAYVTSAGWLGYSDEKVERLTREAVAQGFNHFKMKVGADRAADLRRGKIIRRVIDDTSLLPLGTSPRDPNSPGLQGKNAGPAGAVLMIDANQVWDVPEAIDYVKSLAEIKPWFIEEPTAPDDVLGHAAIRQALKPYGIGVATGEHAHNRIIFKQLLQANAIDVVQLDSCRLAGVSEVLSVILLAAKFGIPVCPHAGGVGLCEYVIHLSLIDYIAVSGSMERNVLEFVDHLHEHFKFPCRINEKGRYVVPDKNEEGYSIEMFTTSIEEYEWPNGTYWKKNPKN